MMKYHAKFLIKLIKQHCDVNRPIMGAEIGVFQGSTSARLLSALPTLHLLMVDPWEDLLDRSYEANDFASWSEDRLRKRLDKLAEHRRLAERATAEFAGRRMIKKMTSAEAAAEQPPASLDVAFLDDNHRYKAVAEGIRNWSPKVKPGGIVCGHDYDGTGDKRGYFGVKRAVDEAAVDRMHVVGVLPGCIWWWIKSGGET